MEILGFLYDAIAKCCKLSNEKQKKYIIRVTEALNSSEIEVKNLEKLAGNLTYAAWVSPFGRPFLSVLSSSLTPSRKKQAILVSPAIKNALVI